MLSPSTDPPPTALTQIVQVMMVVDPSRLEAGYAQGWVRAKLVLDIPLAPDIVTEQEL